MKNKPNLFLVGAPKCGTTSLHHYLEQHPDICMSNPKEPYYFCKDIIQENTHFLKTKKPYLRWYYRFGCRSYKKYAKAFSHCKTQKIVGEASAWYLFSKSAAKEIYSFNPNAKIIIMIRNPVDFLHSLHSHNLSRLSENIDDFEEALKAEQQRKLGKKIPKGALFPSKMYYLELSKFTEQIERYFEYFSKDKIKVITSEDFIKNKIKVYREILEFLEVDPNFTPSLKILNQNIQLRHKKLKFLRNTPYFWKLKKILPLKIYNKIKFLVTKEKARARMNPFLRNKLMNQYRQEVENLSKLLDRDLLKLWGYN